MVTMVFLEYNVITLKAMLLKRLPKQWKPGRIIKGALQKSSNCAFAEEG